jgi:WD40 repeat protein
LSPLADAVHFHERRALNDPILDPVYGTLPRTSHLDSLQDSPDTSFMPLDLDSFSYNQPAFADAPSDNGISWKSVYKQRLHLKNNWAHHNYSDMTFRAHFEAVYCFQFDLDKLITGSKDDTIKIWDLHTHSCIHTFKGHGGSVLCLHYNQEYLVTGSSDSSIIVWSLLSGTLQRRIWGHSESVLGILFTDKWIMSCSKDATIKIWDFETGTLLMTLVGHRSAVNSIQYHNGLIVSASGGAFYSLV